MKKTRVTLFLAAAISAMAMGCGEKTESGPIGGENQGTAAEGETGVEAKTVKIGVTNCSDTDTFTKEVADYLKKLIEEGHPEWDVDFVSAEMDSSIQLSQVEAFIAKKCDYIVMSASDSEANVACVEACNAAGIPLIDYVNTINAEEGSLVYVGGSNTNCGIMMADYVGERLEDGSNVLIMEGAPGASNSTERVKGVTDTLKEKYPGINILESKTANWNQEDALTLMEDWLQAYSDIDAVICMNDNMAMGSAEAIKAAGRSDDNIIIIGADGLEVTMDYIRDGSITASMFYNFQKQAQNVYTVLEEMISKGLDTHEDVFSDFEIIDSSNVEEYVEKYYAN